MAHFLHNTRSILATGLQFINVSVIGIKTVVPARNNKHYYYYYYLLIHGVSVAPKGSSVILSDNWFPLSASYNKDCV